MSSDDPRDPRCTECLVFGAVQGLADGLILVGPDGRILHVNRRAAEILGLEGRRTLGSSVTSALGHPQLATLWFSSLEEEDPVTAEIRVPPDGAIQVTVSRSLSARGEDLGRAVLLRDVTREKRVHLELSASLAQRLVELTEGQASPTSIPSLTRREREVLELLALGLTNSAIADRLNVSVNTVASHLKHLYPKLRVNTRTQAAAFAVSHGICRPEWL